PLDLVSEPNRFPLVVPDNLLQVRDFTRDELGAFEPGLISLSDDPSSLLDAIYGWTSGHPAMTQKICEALVSAGNCGLSEQELVERIVTKLYFDEGRQQDALLMDVEHRYARTTLSDDAAAALTLYGQLLVAPQQFRPGDPVQFHLALSGLASQRGTFLHVPSRIYATAFDAPSVRPRLDSRPL